MREGILEHVSCPLCGADKYEKVLITYDRFDRERNRKFSIVECQECGLMYLNPRVREEFVKAFYEDMGYDPFVSVTGRKDVLALFYKALRRLNLRFKRNVVRGLKLGGKLLDIGCATGEFLEVMQTVGWRVIGVEPDRESREYAIKKGVQVYETLAELVADSEGCERFDVITMWHSLEHMYGLRRTVESVSSLLEPGGYGVIAVPNVDSCGFGVYGEHWVALDAPRHIYHFTWRTLKKLFGMYDMQLMGTRVLVLDTFYNHIKSFFLKRENMLNFYRLIGTMSKEFAKLCFVSRKYTSTLVYIFKKGRWI